MFLSARALDQSLIFFCYDLFLLEFVLGWQANDLSFAEPKTTLTVKCFIQEGSFRKEELCSKLQMKKNVVSEWVPEMLRPTRM